MDEIAYECHRQIHRVAQLTSEFFPVADHLLPVLPGLARLETHVTEQVEEFDIHGRALPPLHLLEIRHETVDAAIVSVKKAIDSFDNLGFPMLGASARIDRNRVRQFQQVFVNSHL